MVEITIFDFDASITDIDNWMGSFIIDSAAKSFALIETDLGVHGTL